jgi:hypothetical protein
VYVLKTDNVSAVATGGQDIEQQQQEMEQMQKRAYSDPRLINEVLKKTVKIKDNRSKFF